MAPQSSADNMFAAVGVGDPHDAGGARGARRQQRDVDRVPIERRVLLVDDHEIESEIAENFDGVRGRRLDEGADELLAGGEALAECGGMRTRRGRDHGAFPIRGSRGLVKNSRSFHTAKC